MREGNSKLFFAGYRFGSKIVADPTDPDSKH